MCWKRCMTCRPRMRSKLSVSLLIEWERGHRRTAAFLFRHQSWNSDGIRLLLFEEDSPESVKKIFNTLAAHAGNEMNFFPRQLITQFRDRLIVNRQIGLVGGDDLLFFRQLWTE